MKKSQKKKFEQITAGLPNIPVIRNNQLVFATIKNAFTEGSKQMYVDVVKFFFDAFKAGYDYEQTKKMWLDKSVAVRKLLKQGPPPKEEVKPQDIEEAKEAELEKENKRLRKQGSL